MGSVIKKQFKNNIAIHRCIINQHFSFISIQKLNASVVEI